MSRLVRVDRQAGSPGLLAANRYSWLARSTGQVTPANLIETFCYNISSTSAAMTTPTKVAATPQSALAQRDLLPAFLEVINKPTRDVDSEINNALANLDLATLHYLLQLILASPDGVARMNTHVYLHELNSIGWWSMEQVRGKKKTAKRVRAYLQQNGNRYAEVSVAAFRNMLIA